MRLNYIGGASVTGGTGPLTLSAAMGLALPALAFVADQAIEYSIVEYTDATLATIAKAESGFGTISSSNVLTRTAPRTKWDGTTYTQAAVAALSFGISNVRVYVAPIAEGGATAFPMRPNLSGNYGINAYVTGSNIVQATDFSGAFLVANRQHVTALKLEAGYPLSQLGVFVTTAVPGALINCAIASIDPSTGYLGRILMATNGLDASSTGFKLGAAAPRMLAPGWYWQLATSNLGPSIRGSDGFTPGPFGIGDRIVRGNSRGRVFADYVVGADAMAGLSGSYNGADNVAHHFLYMR